MIRVSPKEQVSIAELKERFTHKKQLAQRKTEQVEAEAMQQLAFVLQSYEDVLTKLLKLTKQSKPCQLNQAFKENLYMLKKGYESEFVTQSKRQLTEAYSQNIPNSEMWSMHEATNMPINPTITALISTLQAFNVTQAIAEDLGQSRGSIYKEEVKKLLLSAINRGNRKDSTSEETKLLRIAARQYLEELIDDIGKERVNKKYYTDLARGLRKGYELDTPAIEDRPYIKAIKHAMEELGMVRPKRKRKNTEGS